MKSCELVETQSPINNDKIPTLFDDIEMGSKSNDDYNETVSMLDKDKLIYNIDELRNIKKLFFVERDHITVGYRAHENMTIGMCTKTACMMHNETMNIYTHFLPALYNTA